MLHYGSHKYGCVYTYIHIERFSSPKLLLYTGCLYIYALNCIPSVNYLGEDISAISCNRWGTNKIKKILRTLKCECTELQPMTCNK